MREFSRNFGKIEDFSEGDLVSWSEIGPRRQKLVGIVQKLFENNTGGRFVVYARVFSLKKRSYINVLAANLTKLQDCVDNSAEKELLT